MQRPTMPPDAPAERWADLENIPSEDEYEEYAVEQANAGNTEWGFEFLRICEEGLIGNCLSERMRFQLAACLRDIREGVPPGRAMRVEDDRGVGRPSNPQPDWETPLANLAALLYRYGYKAEAINAAISDARQTLEDGKTLDRREAQRIRQKYAPMREWSEAKLIANCKHLHLAGEIQKYSPQT